MLLNFRMINPAYTLACTLLACCHLVDMQYLLACGMDPMAVVAPNSIHRTDIHILEFQLDLLHQERFRRVTRRHHTGILVSSSTHLLL
jgi:hypothetical protein